MTAIKRVMAQWDWHGGPPQSIVQSTVQIITQNDLPCADPSPTMLVLKGCRNLAQVKQCGAALFGHHGAELAILLGNAAVMPSTKSESICTTVADICDGAYIMFRVLHHCVVKLVITVGDKPASTKHLSCIVNRQHCDIGGLIGLIRQQQPMRPHLDCTGGYCQHLQIVVQPGSGLPAHQLTPISWQRLQGGDTIIAHFQQLTISQTWSQHNTSQDFLGQQHRDEAATEVLSRPTAMISELLPHVRMAAGVRSDQNVQLTTDWGAFIDSSVTTLDGISGLIVTPVCMIQQASCCSSTQQLVRLGCEHLICEGCLQAAIVLQAGSDVPTAVLDLTVLSKVPPGTDVWALQAPFKTLCCPVARCGMELQQESVLLLDRYCELDSYWVQELQRLAERLHQSHRPKHLCQFCLTEEEDFALLCTLGCDHRLHWACLVDWITSEKIPNNKLQPDQLYCPVCPADATCSCFQCQLDGITGRHYIHYHTIQEARKHGLDDAMWEKYDTFMLRSSADFDWVECPQGGCGYMVSCEKGSTKDVTCGKCQRKFCRSCFKKWHGSQTCDEAAHATNDEASMATLAMLGLQVCPICGARGCKADLACEKLVGECGHVFCYLCGACYSAVVAHGNQYHRPHCRFHYRCCDKNCCAEEQGVCVEDKFSPKCEMCVAKGSLCTRLLDTQETDDRMQVCLQNLDRIREELAAKAETS